MKCKYFPGCSNMSWEEADRMCKKRGLYLEDIPDEHIFRKSRLELNYMEWHRYGQLYYLGHHPGVRNTFSQISCICHLSVLLIEVRKVGVVTCCVYITSMTPHTT